MCKFAKTMLGSVIFSGPLTDWTSDNMFSYMLSFHQWLSKWCSPNNVGYIDICKTFWRKFGMCRRGGIHLILDEAALLSKNQAIFGIE